MKAGTNFAPLERFCVVLVRAKAAGNIGAAARAMKNFGIEDLRLVKPAPFRNRAAFNMAVHARDVLDKARVFDDMTAALAGCTMTIGTTCRRGPYREGARPLRQFAEKLVGSSFQERIAIVFGSDDSGLSNSELRLCQQLITIPTSERYRSINLAQSVMLVCYELMMAAAARAEPVSRSPARAPISEVESALKRIEESLIAIGFIAADNPDHMMFAVRDIFGRTGLAPREVDILNGIARQISWFANGGHVTLEAKRRAGKKFR